MPSTAASPPRLDALLSRTVYAYAASCILATGVNLAVFAALEPCAPPPVAAAAAWLAATLAAYAVCRRWAFSDAAAPGLCGMLSELARFAGSRALTGAVDVALTWALCAAGLDPLLSKAAGSAFSAVSNYAAARLAVFRG